MILWSVLFQNAFSFSGELLTISLVSSFMLCSHLCQWTLKVTKQTKARGVLLDHSLTRETVCPEISPGPDLRVLLLKLNHWRSFPVCKNIRFHFFSHIVLKHLEPTTPCLPLNFFFFFRKMVSALRLNYMLVSSLKHGYSISFL